MYLCFNYHNIENPSSSPIQVRVQFLKNKRKKERNEQEYILRTFYLIPPMRINLRRTNANQRNQNHEEINYLRPMIFKVITGRGIMVHFVSANTLFV